MAKVTVQQHDFGCGVACVAYVARTSYRRAISLFERPEKAETKGYMYRDLVVALDECGLSYKHRYFRPRHRNSLKIAGVIVYTKRSRKYPAGHYLVRTENGLWMNP